MAEYLYEPGRELDCVVAEEILGMRVEWDIEAGDYAILHKPTKTFKQIPQFSVDTNAVFIVINHLQTKGFFNNVGSSSGGPIPIWRSSFFRKIPGAPVYVAEGKSLAHATCLSALNVVRNIMTVKPMTNSADTSLSISKLNVQQTDNIIQFPGRK